MNRVMVVALILAAATAGCGPRGRSYAWYKAHPDAAAKAMADCGPSRSEDCADAEKALADVRSDRRQAMYRKTF